MADLEWYFPRQISEAVELLSREGVILHAGGTGILRAGTSRLRGLIDVAGLNLDFVQQGQEEARIGAAATYASVVRAFGATDPGHILVRSLGDAATTPLRNRITMGGSIAQFPFWSDLMGPLLALESDVEVAGGIGGRWKMAEYVSRKDLRQGTLVKEVRWRPRPWRAAYHRHTRTRSDHPAFTVTVLAMAESELPRRAADIRIVVAGCAGRYRRLTGLEDALRGQAVLELPLEEMVRGEEVEFSARMGLSPEYLRHCAQVALERAIRQVFEG